MANIAVRRAVYCLVVIPAILKGHAHCVAVKVFVVSDVFAHGDFLFVVCVDALTVTQIWEGASKKCLVVLSKFYYARIKIIRILRYCFIYILLPDIYRG